MLPRVSRRVDQAQAAQIGEHLSARRRQVDGAGVQARGRHPVALPDPGHLVSMSYGHGPGQALQLPRAARVVYVPVGEDDVLQVSGVSAQALYEAEYASRVARHAGVNQGHAAVHQQVDIAPCDAIHQVHAVCDLHLLQSRGYCPGPSQPFLRPRCSMIIPPGLGEVVQWWYGRDEEAVWQEDVPQCGGVSGGRVVCAQELPGDGPDLEAAKRLVDSPGPEKARGDKHHAPHDARREPDRQHLGLHPVPCVVRPAGHAAAPAGRLGRVNH